MNEIDIDIDDEGLYEQIILDDPEPQAPGLRHWLSAHTGTPENDTSTPTQPAPPRPRRWRGNAGAVGVAVLAAAVVTALAGHGPREASSSPVPSPVKTELPQESSVVWVSGTSAGCPLSAPESEAELVASLSGTSALRPRSGEQAIAVFEAAYYRARDGMRAREVVAAAAAIPDARGIQVGIDSVPIGTTYCARIRMLRDDLYAVEIGESRPGEPESVWRQQISTSDTGGQALITAITQL